MKALLTNLFKADKPQGLEQAFDSFKAFSIENENDINNLNEEDTKDLAGNLIIDFNDNFDSENLEHETFWDSFLQPIDNNL